MEFIHKIIRTPIDTLNVIGGGGLNQGTICELWGPPGSGKSAFAYDTASHFLIDNPEGQVLIIDPELSVDLIRLEYVFKLDMHRVNIRNAKTLEDGYALIFSVIREVEKTKKPWLIIWDTIAASKPKDEVDAALAGNNPINAGGMGLKARVNEINLAIVMSGMWEKPITIFLLNQVRTTGFPAPNKPYQTPHDTSTGGNALKHTCHYRLAFKRVKKTWDEKLSMNVGTQSRVDIEKSKFGPTVGNIPVFIDDRIGGRIVSTDEAAQMLHQLKLLNSVGGPWYVLDGDTTTKWTWERNSQTEKNGHWIAGNPDARKRCIDVLARHFRTNYYTLDIVYEKIGLKDGELNEEQKKVRESLISKFDFARILIPRSEGDP